MDFYTRSSALKALFKNSLDAIVFTDERQLIIDINTRFTELFGYALEECKGKHAYDLLAPEHLRFQAQEIAKQVYYGDTVEIETVRFAKGCKPIHVSVKAVPIIINNKVVGGYGIYSDISARKAYEEELKRLSMYDALTGLYNRKLAIADAFVVMTNGRPYKTRLSKEEALKELVRCAGTQFDPKLVEMFVKLMNEE